VAELPASPGNRRRLPAVFWLLIASGLLTIGLGIWWLMANASLSRAEAAAAPLPAAGKPSPATDFQLADLSGHQVRLSDLRGKVVLLNFWATWCPPCKAEMPDLQALYAEYGSQHDFIVIAVNVEESRETAEAFARQYGLTFPILPDSDGRVSNQRYFIRSLPTSFIIDRTGHVRDTWLGQQTRRSMLTRLASVW